MVSPMKKVGRKSRSLKKVGRKSRSLKKVKGVKKSNEIRFRFYRCARGCNMEYDNGRGKCTKCGYVMIDAGLY